MADEEKKYVPLAPYDLSLMEHFTIYDSFPYECNRDLCKGKIGMSTGKIVKYYTCKLSEKAVSIGAIDVDSVDLSEE